MNSEAAPDGDANADRERSAIEAGERGAPGGGISGGHILHGAMGSHMAPGAEDRKEAPGDSGGQEA